MAMQDGQNPKKTPGQTVADAALAGYDKGAQKKADGKMDFSLIPSLKKGGIVKKTGLHLLHKGEEVIPANKVKSLKHKGTMRKKASAKA